MISGGRPSTVSDSYSRSARESAAYQADIEKRRAQAQQQTLSPKELTDLKKTQAHDEAVKRAMSSDDYWHQENMRRQREREEQNEADKRRAESERAAMKARKQQELDASLAANEIQEELIGCTEDEKKAILARNPRSACHVRELKLKLKSGEIPTGRPWQSMDWQSAIVNPGSVTLGRTNTRAWASDIVKK